MSLWVSQTPKYIASILGTEENFYEQQSYPTIITHSLYFVNITNMKTAKDSTRPKGNYDGPTLGQSSCLGRKKIGKREYFLLRVINNTKDPLQVAGYGALSAKMQCIPSFITGCSCQTYGNTTNKSKSIQ